eukprot:199961_1
MTDPVLLSLQEFLNMQLAINQNHKIDSAIFESNKKQCVKSMNNITNSCYYLHRILLALKYYSSLNIDNNTLSNDKLIEFFTNIYKNILNDWMHVIKKHAHQVEQINKELMTKQPILTCDIKNCQLTSRHYDSSRNRKLSRKNNQKIDSKFIFYRDTLDNIHFYLFHLYDVGLRITQTKNDEYNNKSKNNNKYACFDDHFANKRKIIMQKRQTLKFDTDRFNRTNNKFNLNVELKTDEVKDEEQWMDTMFENINADICTLHKYVADEEYDTESIQQDVSNTKASNIMLFLQYNNYNKCAVSLMDYVKCYRLRSSSFSTGFIFYYWSYYKKSATQQKKTKKAAFNIKDYGGYNIEDMYVSRTYDKIR